MKYYGNFVANHSTTLCKPISDTNKCKLLRELVDMAKAERFSNNTVRWHIWTEKQVQDAIEPVDIMCGYVDEKGRNHTYYF